MKLFYIFIFFALNLNAQQSYIDYLSPYHPVVSNSGMVVSQNNFSSDIGVEILSKGGNAIDAAVAVGFSLAITLPRAGNLGGGGFMLVYLKEKDEIFYIDYRSKSPLNSSIDNIFNLNGKNINPKDFTNDMFNTTRYGYKAPAIPGTVAGLLEAHEKFGSLPLEEVLAPVIRQAREGILVSYDLEKAIEDTHQLKKDPESLKIYFKNGSAIKENSIFKRPDLEKTFKLIASNGKDGFYKGDIAKAIVKAMNENDGLFSLTDFENYKVQISEPIVASYRGNLVFTAGPPSGGGITLLTALNILSFFDLQKFNKDSAITYHLISEALRRGHNNRSHFVGDPDYFDVPINQLLSKKRTMELAKTIDIKKASKSTVVKPLELIKESRDTTHFSIIDKEGNAVSNTYTLGYSFGSGVTIPNTGILMNNQMNNFAYRYGDKNIRGRGASTGNRFEAGKSPMSTMAPTMIFDKEGDLMMITGSPGGSLIPAAILRVITGVIDFDLDIGEATMLPRVHKDWPTTGILYERTLNSDVVRIINKNIGHKMTPEHTMGSTQSIHIIDQINYGFADLRRPNASVSVQSN
ncbi:MAG: gamma-glutamyltransferase [Gammaproteobacteria bacterium TMED226]|nr:MAG: gamma-glutamyltransferase [Gammaproteobacteria bacterium TMED226]|tara:strand:+ start:6805 stop:8535 length:1731 start_codon:yes stop_codon:yes gene_type:complete